MSKTTQSEKARFGVYIYVFSENLDGTQFWDTLYRNYRAWPNMKSCLHLLFFVADFLLIKSDHRFSEAFYCQISYHLLSASGH